jgi:hypothetical protein
MIKFNNPQDMALVGQKTPQAVIYKSESHKLHQAFVVKTGENIIQGQPVQINEDGTIQAWKKEKDGGRPYIGIAVTDSYYPAYPGNEVTVAVRGFMVVYGLSNGEIKAGPVTPDPTAPVDDTNTYIKYNQGTDDEFIALNTASSAGELIQVLVR